MKLKYLKAALCCLCFLYASQKSFAQSAQTLSIKKIGALMDSTQKASPVEKLYIHFDKPYYAIGDTIWFKSYLFNAAYLTGSSLNSLFYMEFINEKNVMVKRFMFPVAAGLSWGNIGLNAKEFTKGKYRINAYTNWMRNFGEDYIFKKDVYVGGVAVNEWQVNSAIDLKKEPGKAHVILKFNQEDKVPLRLKALELIVKNGTKVLYHKSQETNLDGIAELVFSLDSNEVKDGLVLNAKDPKAENDGQETMIPVTSALQNDIDLQFMPEGGNIVAGLPAHISFKAIRQDGRSVTVNADVFDQHRQKIVALKTGHGGMGAFDITPKAGEKYTANVMFKNGQLKTYPLPEVKDYGTVLRIEDTGTDSLIVNISAAWGSRPLNSQYYIVGQARGLVCYAAAVNVAAGLLCIVVPKSAFPTGVGRFTLLDNMLRPLNDRIVFIDHHDALHIDIEPDRSSFNKRDSINLEVKVTDQNGQPVEGNFSLAVTDKAQVKADTANNIRNYMLLTSDLKGEVEDAGYYFKSDSSAKRKHDLDNLLLTQGWVGYNWDNVVKPGAKPAFNTEPDFKISGRVRNIFNKPIRNTHILLLSKKPQMMMDTTTDAMGRFTFTDILPLDTPAYVIRARNKNGKSFNLNIVVDDFKPPVFAKPVFSNALYTSQTDSILLNYMNNYARRLKNMDDAGLKGHLLKQVNIRAKKIIKGSNNLNGPGNADVVIDQEELEKAGKKTFLDLLQERVTGFRTGSLVLAGNSSKAYRDLTKSYFLTDTTGGVNTPLTIGVKNWYYVYDKPIKFFVDGISVMLVKQGGPHNGAEIMASYLKENSAEDIKGIEVMTTTGNVAKYAGVWKASDFAIVEITTRSGNGPVINNTIGRYLYRPLPFSLPAFFYRPRYTVKDKAEYPDLRSTIHWEPNLVTDATGKAHVSFYASDSNTGYSIIVQGADMDGSVGYGVGSINLK